MGIAQQEMVRERCHWNEERQQLSLELRQQQEANARLLKQMQEFQTDQLASARHAKDMSELEQTKSSHPRNTGQQVDTQSTQVAVNKKAYVAQKQCKQAEDGCCF